jgi:hypothetical protein
VSIHLDDLAVDERAHTFEIDRACVLGLKEERRIAKHSERVAQFVRNDRHMFIARPTLQRVQLITKLERTPCRQPTGDDPRNPRGKYGVEYSDEPIPDRRWESGGVADNLDFR